MGSGCRVTAGPANDARRVCDVEALWRGRVQVKMQPGGGPLGPVTKVETQPSSTQHPHLHCTLHFLCVQQRDLTKNIYIYVL